MTPQDAAEHVAALRAMVEQSRHARIRTGDLYLVWGGVVIAAMLGQVVLDALGVASPWIVWFGLTPFGVTYAVIRGRSEAAKVVTYASRVEGQAWLFVGLAMASLVAGGAGSGMLAPRAIVPIIAAMVAVALGTAAALYRAAPLVGSAVIFLVTSTVSWFLAWQVQFAAFAGALLFGYVVPGVWMMRASRSHA